MVAANQSEAHRPFDIHFYAQKNVENPEPPGSSNIETAIRAEEASVYADYIKYTDNRQARSL